MVRPSCGLGRLRPGGRLTLLGFADTLYVGSPLPHNEIQTLKRILFNQLISTNWKHVGIRIHAGGCVCSRLSFQITYRLNALFAVILEYVAPLGSTSLVFNFMFASLIGTPVTKWDIYVSCGPALPSWLRITSSCLSELNILGYSRCRRRCDWHRCLRLGQLGSASGYGP